VGQAAYGDRAGEIWAALADNIVTVTPGWSEAYGLFLDGEADMVLSYTRRPPTT
jgi:thiamine transport system substrate-binding protein